MSICCLSEFIASIHWSWFKFYKDWYD